MKNKMKLPTNLGKARRKKFKRQRERWGFSDYDCWDLDYYLMELIPSAMEHLADISHSYSECMWMFDTRAIKTDVTAEEYKTELLKVAAEFRRACQLMEHAAKKDEIDKAIEVRLHCFEWLGHNIGMLWD